MLRHHLRALRLLKDSQDLGDHSLEHFFCIITMTDQTFVVLSARDGQVVPKSCTQANLIAVACVGSEMKLEYDSHSLYIKMYAFFCFILFSSIYPLV